MPSELARIQAKILQKQLQTESALRDANNASFERWKNRAIHVLGIKYRLCQELAQNGHSAILDDKPIDWYAAGLLILTAGPRLAQEYFLFGPSRMLAEQLVQSVIDDGGMWVEHGEMWMDLVI